jgi:glycosyltransferase involved in cell wall biosynthesis
MQKKFPLVSILITNYNKKKYLKKMLNSCVNQSYKNKEIIFYDDASSDTSLSIVQEYKSIKIIKNKSKKYKSGPLNQINGIIECFKKSKGELIFLLDSDDCFKKNKLEKISKVISNNNEYKFVQDTPVEINGLKKIKLKRKNHFFSIWPQFYPTSSITIRRKFFSEFLPYLKKNSFEDLEVDARLVIFAYIKKEFRYIEKSYTYYNNHMEGITSDYKKYSLNWWKKRNDAFQYMFNLMKKFNIKIKKSPDYFLTKLIIFLLVKNS